MTRRKKSRTDKANIDLPRIRDIPKFGGKSDEDFDQWRQESSYYVRRLDLVEMDRVQVILMGLSGLARKLVA